MKKSQLKQLIKEVVLETLHGNVESLEDVYEFIRSAFDYKGSNTSDPIYDSDDNIILIYGTPGSDIDHLAIKASDDFSKFALAIVRRGSPGKVTVFEEDINLTKVKQIIKAYQ